MFLFALLAVLATSFFGWLVIGVSAIMLIWMVARIHQEFSGGSGTKKLWPTIWFLAVPIAYLVLAANAPTKLPEEAGFVSNMWANLTVWHALGLLGYYVLIGLGYAAFEMRVVLWRDKKNKVAPFFEKYMGQFVKTELLNYLNIKLGSSAVGPETTVLKQAVLNEWNSVKEKAVLAEQGFKSWAHMLPAELTLAEAFIRNANPREVLASAEQGFKDDVVKFEAGLKNFLAEFNHNSFNPVTSYLEVSINTDGTLDPSIKKADLAICLANWTGWWPGYALNFIFGDMVEAIFTRLSAWIIRVYGGYVKKYFADLVAVKL